MDYKYNLVLKQSPKNKNKNMIKQKCSTFFSLKKNTQRN